jgi:hypothetical protein
MGRGRGGGGMAKEASRFSDLGVCAVHTHPMKLFRDGLDQRRAATSGPYLLRAQSSATLHRSVIIRYRAPQDCVHLAE